MRWHVAHLLPLSVDIVFLLVRQRIIVGFTPVFVLLGQAEQLRLERSLCAFSITAKALMTRDCQLFGLCRITILVIGRDVVDDFDRQTRVL